jgi:hypothetical protein
MLLGANPIWLDKMIEDQLTDEGYRPLGVKKRPSKGAKLLGWRGYRFGFGKGLQLKLKAKEKQDGVDLLE